MLSRSIAEEFIRITGRERFFDRPEELFSYAYDAFTVEKLPEAVLLPLNSDEVSRIMTIASREKIPVTARGAGTSISGAAVPLRGGLVLSFTKMNRILEVNTRDRYCIVEPGVVNGELQKALAAKGFFYPPDPGSLEFSTIGGNVAHNAGGPRCLKYGVTVDYVLGMEVVTASGDIVRFGSRNMKDVSGYRLSSLFCGSEGTLGLVTEITLRVVPLPEAFRTVLAVYNDLEASANTVADVIGSGVLPAAMELMDKVVINAIEDVHHLGLPREAEGVLLIEVDGPELLVEKELAKIVEKARANGAIDIQKARTTADRDSLWRARRSTHSVFARLAPNCIVEDATVPVSRVPKMIKGVRQIADKYRLCVGILAHAGDGNMHPLIATDIRNEDEWQRVEAAIREIFELAVSLGGTLSGEHGVGIAKQAFLPLVQNEATRHFMATIKAAVDPFNLLNPGKSI